MKATISDIKRFAVHDGDGIRTTVFFKGCPLKCLWCHNPESISLAPQLAYYSHKCVHCGMCVSVCPNGAHSLENGIHTFERSKCIACGKCESQCLGQALIFYGKKMSVEEIVKIALEDMEFYKNSGGGVTLSGGECLMQADFCAQLLKQLKSYGIHTAVDTCGFVNVESIVKVMPYTDVFLYDIKHITEEEHRTCTGQSNKIILDNIKYISDHGGKIEVRIPFVPEYNADVIKVMAEFLKSIPAVFKVKVLPYHNLAGTKYESLGMENTLPKILPTDEQIDHAVGILKKNGLNVLK